MSKKADKIVGIFPCQALRKYALFVLIVCCSLTDYAQPASGHPTDITGMNMILIGIVAILAVIIIYKEKTLRDTRLRAQNSDQRFRKLYDTGLVGLLFTNLDGRVVHANKAFLNIIGYTVQDVQAGVVNWNALTPAEYIDVTKDALGQMYQNGFCSAFEKEYIHKDGHRVDVMLGAALLDKNDFAEAVTYVIDISYKKQAEIREHELNIIIKKQREELNGILMNAPAMIAIRRGPELKLEFSNKVATNFVKANSSMGLTTRELFEKFKVIADPAISQEVYRTGKPYQAKAFHIQLDRFGTGKPEDVWLDLVLEPVYDNNGKIDGVSFFGFDVSELVNANREVKESENRFRFLADTIPHKVWTSGPDGRATYYNKGWYDYTGKTEFAELNKRIWEIIHPDDLETAKTRWSNSVEAGESLELEQRFMDINGEYLWHLTRVNAHKDADGKVIMWVGSSTNIHEQKMAQKATSLLLKRKDEFLGIASHELKTPITSMKASLQILDRFSEDEFSSQKVRPFIGMANKQVKKLTDIVDDLLDVTKIQSGKMQLNITDYLFRDSVYDCISEIQQYTDGHRLVIKKNDEVEVSADRTRIEQVMVNLLSNAIKYSPGKEQVLINIEKNRSDVKFSVTDFGIGIPRDKQSFIFDRFFRVHESSQNFSGLGLGLYISMEIIDRHEGKMGMESEEGKGSTFWFTLPVTH